MTKEEDFFKENFPEYVTEKGEFLSPYWDLFSAGVICANFELNNKIAELKAYNEKLLNGDIEKHNKIVEMGKENSRLKQIILGNEMEIAAKDETIEELKKQVQGYLINHSDNT